MKILVPMAGKGTRLRPFTYIMPKPMIRVAGKEVILHILDSFKSLPKAEGIHFIIGPESHEIIDFVKAHSPWPVTYSVQEEPLGLGHAIFQAKDFIEPDEDIYICLGDTIIYADFGKLIENKTDFIGVMTVDDPRRFGIVVLKDGYIAELEEKPERPKSNIAITGAYYISSAGNLFEALEYIITNNIKVKNEFHLTPALQNMLEKGWKPKPVFVEQWLDCGTIDSVLESNKKLLEKFDGYPKNLKNSKIIPPVLIKDNVKIENSLIGPYVYIEENTVISNVIIKNSIVYRGSRIENMVIKDSFIGENTTLKGQAETFLLASYGSVTKETP